MLRAAEVIANELQAGFKHDPFNAFVWKDGIFGPGGIAFDSLAQSAGRADFAAFVISPDDTVLSRHKEHIAPRDNVIFELGLFMGVLDRKRVVLRSMAFTDGAKRGSRGRRSRCRRRAMVDQEGHRCS